MTERIYKHMTATDHYMQTQMLLAHASSETISPEYRASLLQEAQVHATLATARVEPLFESGRSDPVSVSKHTIGLFRSELTMLGLNPDEWELDPILESPKENHPAEAEYDHPDS